MKVIHIVGALDPVGGISAAVRGLAAAQNALGGGSAEILTANDARFADLPAAFADFDIVHVHSNWTHPVHAAMRAALAADKVLVVHTHANLDPLRLRHHALRKRLMGWLCERRLLAAADLLVATSPAEKGWIEAYLAPVRPRRVAIVPLGVDPRPDRPFADHRPRTLLYLGRIAPLKGLDLLCAAWKLTPHPNWRLVLAGPDEEGTRAHLTRLLAATNAAREPVPSVSFLPPVLDQEAKWRLIESADALVLPSLSENYGLVVAEALAEGVPVLTTTATPWAAVDSACGLVVPPTVAGLVNGLSRLFALPARGLGDSLAAWSAASRAFARERCSWSAAAEALGAAYRLAYADHK